MNFLHSHNYFASFICVLALGLMSDVEVQGQELQAPASTLKIPILDTVIESWPVDALMTRQQEQAIWRSLCQPYTPIAINIPLDRWADSVASICPLEIDVISLEGIGLSPNVPLSFRLDTPPQSLLVHTLSALGQLECVVEISRGVVRITTGDAADLKLPVRIYDISKLIGGSDGREKLAAVSVLMHTIQNVIEPDGWEMLGGPSVMQVFPTNKRQLLCVATRTETHWQLQVFLDQLQRAGGDPRALEPSVRSPSQIPRAKSRSKLLKSLPRFEGELPRFRPQ